MLIQSLVVVWYALHGHHPDDALTRRLAQPWYQTKTEPSFEDMITKLRKTLIVAPGLHPIPQVSPILIYYTTTPWPAPQPPRNCETREGHDSGVNVRPQLPKIAFMTMAGGLRPWRSSGILASPRQVEEVVMHLGVVHEIRDPAGWGCRDGWGPRPSAPAMCSSGASARRRHPGDVLSVEAPSLDDLQRLLDGAVGRSRERLLGRGPGQMVNCRPQTATATG